MSGGRYNTAVVSYDRPLLQYVLCCVTLQPSEEFVCILSVFKDKLYKPQGCPSELCYTLYIYTYNASDANK